MASGEGRSFTAEAAGVVVFSDGQLLLVRRLLAVGPWVVVELLEIGVCYQRFSSNYFCALKPV